MWPRCFSLLSHSQVMHSSVMYLTRAWTHTLTLPWFLPPPPLLPISPPPLGKPTHVPTQIGRVNMPSTTLQSWTSSILPNQGPDQYSVRAKLQFGSALLVPGPNVIAVEVRRPAKALFVCAFVHETPPVPTPTPSIPHTALP